MDRNKELWVGWCYVIPNNAKHSQGRDVFVAAWSDSVESFCESVAYELNFLDYQVEFSKKNQPFVDWLPDQSNAQELKGIISRVNSANPLSFGPLPQRSHSEDDTEQCFLKIETFTVDPLPEKQQAWPEKYLPDEVLEHLFSEELHTYAVINAQRIQFLDSLLENSGLEHVCLVKNATSLQAMSNSPWLVQLKADNKFSQSLFSSDPEDRGLSCYWQKDPAIYLQSAASTDELALHLGRFFRVQDEQAADKFYFFYYFNPEIAASYFVHIKDWRERVIKWFCPSQASKIEAMYVMRSNEPCLKIQPNPDLQAAGESIKAFRLSARDRAGFKTEAERENIEKMFQQLKSSLAGLELSDELLQQELMQSIERNKQFDIQDGEHLFMLALMAIGFENRTQWHPEARDYADSQLKTQLPEAQRVQNYIECLQKMEQAS